MGGLDRGGLGVGGAVSRPAILEAQAHSGPCGRPASVAPRPSLSGCGPSGPARLAGSITLRMSPWEHPKTNTPSSEVN